MFLVFSFQYVKERISGKPESVMNTGIEPIPFPGHFCRRLLP
jgi:hypothetical protein